MITNRDRHIYAVTGEYKANMIALGSWTKAANEHLQWLPLSF